MGISFLFFIQIVLTFLLSLLDNQLDSWLTHLWNLAIVLSPSLYERRKPLLGVMKTVLTWRYGSFSYPFPESSCSVPHVTILVVYCLVFAVWGLHCYIKGKYFFHCNLTLNRPKAYMYNPRVGKITPGLSLLSCGRLKFVLPTGLNHLPKSKSET